MDSRDLEIFLLLAETLHFGRAAQQGNLSPSALSRTIQRLEGELDCRLFDRSNREVRLTPQGRLFQAQARDLLERMRDLRRRVRADSAALHGSLTLYCSVTASYSLLAGLLPEFRARYPGVEINLHTGDEASALRRVAQGREDLAIAARPDQLPANIAFLELATTPLVFIAPPASQFERLPGAEPALDWSLMPMILPETVDATHAYRAARALFRRMTSDVERLRDVFCPAMATGVGGVAPAEAARAMRRALGDALAAGLTIERA